MCFLKEWREGIGLGFELLPFFGVGDSGGIWSKWGDGVETVVWGIGEGAQKSCKGGSCREGVQGLKCSLRLPHEIGGAKSMLLLYF